MFQRLTLPSPGAVATEPKGFASELDVRLAIAWDDFGSALREVERICASPAFGAAHELASITQTHVAHGVERLVALLPAQKGAPTDG